jgi:hypothetical protein
VSSLIKTEGHSLRHGRSLRHLASPKSGCSTSTMKAL